MRADTDSVHYLLEEVARSAGDTYNLLNWYRRNVDANKPPANIGADFSKNPTATYLANPNAKVADQTTLWALQGQIYMVVRRFRPKELAAIALGRSFGEEEDVQYLGVCSNQYAVAIEDHFIDEDSNEFRVVSCDRSRAGSHYYLTLKRL